MIRSTRVRFAFLLMIVIGAPATSVAQAKRLITETDLFKFVWAADPQISPNGSQVAFVRVNVNEDKDRYDLRLVPILVNVNEDKDRYETQIFVVPADGSAPTRP